MLGSAIIKSLIGNLLEKLGSDLLGTWNLADNIEINSFSPLDIELRNLPIPQIIFEVADLPFIVIYSNVRLVKVSLKTDQMPSEENPLSIEGWDVDLQIRLASLDEWDSRKWCRRLLKSKRKKILRWYKYVSPWSTNKVADQISQSLETSIVNSLNIKLHNVHCVLIDDHLGPSPFAIDISSDSFFITSANDPGVLSEEELRGKESHLLQFLWIRFYGFRAVFRRSDHPLLASVPKNVVTKLVDIEGDATTALGVEEDEDEEEEEEGEEREGGGLGPDRHESSPPGRERSGFFSRLIGSLVQFFSPDKSEGQKINLLSSFLCSLNGQSSSQFEILRELSEIPVGSRDYSSAELPRHSQNGNSRFIRLPDDPSGCIQVTKDQGIEFHILFKRWDIRALNAPSCMFGSVFEDERQCREYISSREWKASKLIFLPSSDRYLKRPPSTETLADETFELTCTEDVVSVLYNFINYLSQWSAFLKASQYVYSNRKTHKELEEYLSSLVRCNGGSRRNGGPSSIPKQLLSEMETEISIRDVIALHMSADEFLKEGFSSKGGGFWRAFGRSPGVDAEALHRFVLERVLGGRTWEKFAEAKSVTRDKEVWIPDSKEIDCMKFSTFGRWFSSEGRLQVVIPKGRVSVVMSDLSSISSKASPVPDWMRSLLQERSPGEGVLGRMSGLIFEFDLNMLADKISFYHRQTSMKIFRLEILEGEFGLACGQLGRGRSRPESTGGHGSLMRTASHVMRAFPLTFLPGARVLEVGAGCCSRHGLEAGHGRDCGFEDCMDTFVGRASRRASRLRLVDIDDNEVGVGEPGRDGERRPGVGLMLSIHQLFGRVILRDIKVPNDTVIPGFCPGFDYSIMDDEYLPHFNSNSVEISDLVLHDFKGIWRVASLVPNVTSNILSIISRSSRTSEAHLVRSLMEMISISAKDNALYSLSLQGVRVSSRYPNTTNTASRYSTRHLSLDKHLHDARSHPGCLACRLAPGGRRRWPGARTESPPELGLTTFRVGGQDLRSPDRCSAETLDKKVARIVSEILVSPDDFLQSLKTYRVMESSQSIFRGLTGLTLNSSFGNLASCEYEYKCEDEETGQVSESLLYNEILRYLLQNDYFIEENVSFTGIQIGLSSLCLQTRVGRGTLFLEMKGLSLCMLANQPEESARDPGRDGLGFSERQRKEEERRLEFLWMDGLSVQLSERQLDLSLSGVSVNVFPAIMTAINGYELLVFPKRSQVDLGRMFRNVSSFRVNKIETRGHRHSGSGGLRSLECLTVRLDEASVQIYDTEYLLYQLSLFDLRIRCMQSLAGRSRMTMSIALGEVFIQSINNIILGDQNLGYQRIRSDFSGRHFFTPSVVFSKLSGHLVPSQKMHTKSGDISHFPYVLVHSDQFQTSSKTGTESDMLEEDPILSLEVRVRAREGGADESQSSLEEGAPETTKYVISVISKVRNGNFFFTDDDMIRLKSIFSLYRRISSQFRRERNSLWSSDFVLERESPLEAYRLSRQGAGGEAEAEAERPPLESSDFCGDCGGLSIDLMGEVKNRDEYFVEVSLKPYVGSASVLLQQQDVRLEQVQPEDGSSDGRVGWSEAELLHPDLGFLQVPGGREGVEDQDRVPGDERDGGQERDVGDAGLLTEEDDTQGRRPPAGHSRVQGEPAGRGCSPEVLGLLEAGPQEGGDPRVHGQIQDQGYLHLVHPL
ncbi:hypothetical protein OJ252_2257 [Cryptosporidium canis]|uniref:Chorein N-terminal domain-containing protein n=1 Tax=Cryptosporidium canis TaxID=195482 RepID=A0ABQ8P5S4_9CRYT|nr:hypothetical protein OJ252_2257 [Cryptosporidium canis]